MGKIKNWCEEHKVELAIMGTAVVSASIAGGIVYHNCTNFSLEQYQQLKPIGKVNGVPMCLAQKSDMQKALAVGNAMANLGYSSQSAGSLAAVAKGETVEELTAKLVEMGFDPNDINTCLIAVKK